MIRLWKLGVKFALTTLRLRANNVRRKNYKSWITVLHFVDKCEKHGFGLTQLA